MNRERINREMLQQIVLENEFPQSNSQIFIGPAQKVCSRVARLLVMEKGQILPERKSWSNVAISILRGTCEIVFDGLSKTLGPEDVLHIPANCEHEIKSLTFLRAVVSFDACNEIE